MANIVYEKLKEAAEANALTDAQIQSVTKQQVAVYFGIDPACIGDAALNVAKEKLLRNRRIAKWQTILDDLKTPVKNLIANDFPDAEFAVDHRRRTVTIFFEGKPPEGEQL